MPKEIKRILVQTAGIILVVLGVLGLALPLLQGILFLAIGLILLSSASPNAHKWIKSHTIRYPRFHSLVQKTEKWITDIIGTVDESENHPDSNNNP
ncbi:MAG: PGPGW domain-containing protein [bacterium]|nr:PGPGW domain-containing protein [bacterium]